MSDYIKATNFTPKDSLPSGDPLKIIKGSDFDVEFDAIETAMATKANKVSTSGFGKILQVSPLGDLEIGALSITDVLARANHTGTQLLSTISDAGALAALDSVTAAQIDVNAVGQSEIQSSSVGQSELKTSTNTISMTGQSVSLLAAGAYGFYPESRMTAIPEDNDDDSLNFTLSMQTGHSFDNTGSSTAQALGSWIGLSSSNDNTIETQAQVRQRYVTASPPYNLGHGDIAHFVFLKLDSDDNIVTQYIADTPPWAYNGKTDIRPDKVVSDGFGGLVKSKWVVCDSCPTHPADGGDPAEYAAFMTNPVRNLVVIDNEMKNADMADIPHPFGADLRGGRVVLLDPASGIVDQLAAMHEAGADVAGLIQDGHVVIGEEILDCNKPDGVSVHQAHWRKV